MAQKKGRGLTRTDVEIRTWGCAANPAPRGAVDRYQPPWNAACLLADRRLVARKTGCMDHVRRSASTGRSCGASAGQGTRFVDQGPAPSSPRCRGSSCSPGHGAGLRRAAQEVRRLQPRGPRDSPVGSIASSADFRAAGGFVRRLESTATARWWPASSNRARNTRHRTSGQKPDTRVSKPGR